MQPFVRWGAGHLAALVLTFAVPLACAWLSRRDRSGRIGHSMAVGFALLLVGQIVVLFFWLDRGDAPRWQDMLPLHLCDLTLFACAIACVTRSIRVYELAYFWGLAGTAQGLFTPDLDYGFPSPQFWFFFLGHGGIIASVLFLTAALGLRPHWRSVLRAYLALLAYAVVAGLFNTAFGTNYGYLCEKPAVSSLLDWLGPWPWYIGSMALAGLLMFVILYLPWTITDHVRSRRATR